MVIENIIEFAEAIKEGKRIYYSPKGMNDWRELENFDVFFPGSIDYITKFEDKDVIALKKKVATAKEEIENLSKFISRAEEVILENTEDNENTRINEYLKTVDLEKMYEVVKLQLGKNACTFQEFEKASEHALQVAFANRKLENGQYRGNSYVDYCLHGYYFANEKDESDFHYKIALEVSFSIDDDKNL